MLRVFGHLENPSILRGFSVLAILWGQKWKAGNVMSIKFPHLTNNESDFPQISNIDVYKYDNDFDYSRYDYDQMQLQICSVPWDMGEAHIGNRVISGIGNVVYFETKAKRDKWFADIPDSECYRFDTKFKELHRDMYIDVPVPYDVCARYNYLCVHYNLFANDDSPVMYERNDGLLDWYWFIREVEFLAPNTTRLHIMLDAFQTFIYDLHVTNMVLERGHAPLFATNVNTYLSNPVSNCADLLAPDVNFAESPSIAKKSTELVFNAKNMKAVIVTTANPTVSWGSKSNDTWNVQSSAHYTMQGTESYLAFAINASDITDFLANVDRDAPQFMQTVKAVCFISSDFLTLGSSFSFCSISCNLINAGYTASDLYEFSKTDFGFGSKYQDIAKLYTYPYSKLVVTDENGYSMDVRIEDCKGKLQFRSKIGLVWPWLNINGQLSGIGKTASKTVNFVNVSSNSFTFDGNWYDYLFSWNIPTFGITQDAGINNDFATHFDRLQEAYAALMEYTNSTAQAATNYANAINSNQTVYQNALNSAGATLGDANDNAANMVAIAALQNALSTALNSANNTKADSSCFATQMLNGSQTDAAYAFTNATTNNQVDYQYATGNIAAFQSGINGAVSGGSTLAAGGPYAAVAGALIGGAVSAFGALAGAQAGVNLTTSQASATLDQMLANLLASDVATGRERDAIIANNNSQLSATANFTTACANANAATLNGNAARDYSAASTNASNTLSTDNTNALNTRNTLNDVATNNQSVATSAITNQVKQADLAAPLEFGDFAFGETSVSRPMGLFCNVVTQNDYAIACAGDEFLRYGYRYDRQWTFTGNWNVGKYFTYWKLRDFWIRDINIPDMYIDQIRFFLLEGVTIWRKPEDIGKISIYENWS